MARPKVKKAQLAEYRPDLENINVHSERGRHLLEESLQSVGWLGAITVDKDGVIIGGELRQEVAEAIQMGAGYEIEIDGDTPLIIKRRDLDFDSEDEATATRTRQASILDNRTADFREYDAQRMESLQAAGHNLGQAGFTAGELARLLQPKISDVPEAQIDRAAELQEIWAVKTGDLWVIPSASGDGEHRLLCGDSTVREDVERVMDGERADAVVTDPPYGIGIVKKNTAGNFPGTNAPRLKVSPIIGDDKPFNPSHLLNIAPIIILWGANHYAESLPSSSKWLVWDKKDGAFEASDLGDCELAWTNMTGAARLLHHTWQGMYRSGAGERSARVHPTQKPVDLMKWCIDQSGVGMEAIIFDAYGGSGTTMVACEQLGRLARMIEIEPKYCAVILERMQALGLAPERTNDAQ